MTDKNIEEETKFVISTHTLTWSVTKDRGGHKDDTSISTHTLTWSVTGVVKVVIHILDFNSHAHVERDLLLKVT